MIKSFFKKLRLREWFLNRKLLFLKCYLILLFEFNDEEILNRFILIDVL